MPLQASKYRYHCIVNELKTKGVIDIIFARYEGKMAQGHLAWKSFARKIFKVDYLSYWNHPLIKFV